MRFYWDIISAEDPQTPGGPGYRYHQWSPSTIGRYWQQSAQNPFIRRQYYPMKYWQDLLAWAGDRITPSPTTIADVGCGVGNLVRCLRDRFAAAAITGVDLSEESLTPARARFARDADVGFSVGALNGLPFSDAAVDLVTCTEVLEHSFIDVFEKSFFEIGRVLRPGGFYLATVPLEEQMALVCCPSCSTVYTPWQHMLFEITRDDIRAACRRGGLEVLDFYDPIDTTLPAAFTKRLKKRVLLHWFPDVARRVYPKAGATGFLARKV